MLRTFRYQLKSTHRQATTLGRWLAVGCELYNAAFEERRVTWESGPKSVDHADPSAQLTETAAFDPESQPVPVDWAREPLRGVHRAFQAFLRRRQRGSEPGGRRLGSTERYPSLIFSGDIDGQAIRVDQLGSTGFQAQRKWKGRVKSCVLRHTARGSGSGSLVSEIATAGAKTRGQPRGRDPRRALQLHPRFGCPGYRAARVDDGSRGEGRGSQSLPKPQAPGPEQPPQRPASPGPASGTRGQPAPEFLPPRFQVSCLELPFNRLRSPQSPLDDRGPSLEVNPGCGLGSTALAIGITEPNRPGATPSPRTPRARPNSCSACGQNVPNLIGGRLHRCPGCGLVFGRDCRAALNILALR